MSINQMTLQMCHYRRVWLLSESRHVLFRATLPRWVSKEHAEDSTVHLPTIYGQTADDTQSYRQPLMIRFIVSITNVRIGIQSVSISRSISMACDLPSILKIEFKDLQKALTSPRTQHPNRGPDFTTFQFYGSSSL